MLLITKTVMMIYGKMIARMIVIMMMIKMITITHNFDDDETERAIIITNKIDI